ncbi:MAG: thymidine phosphorylase [Bacteroidetes bacterium]|nr:thymidine phosphorylase [Bacteroidota bacterium]
MNPVELILKKRSGAELTPDEIGWLILSYSAGHIPEYQMSAFLMAVFFRGMTDRETVHLTRCMMESGVVLDLSDSPGIKVDKHSTGGVGDKVSIILAPMVAACGVPVPMISGRGLGHTGGTLDKLESIPGFSTQMGLDEYRAQLKRLGTVLIGQTRDLAPVDKELYGLRDVTGTVESIPLIAGSIMSKKLAEGIDALVLDVKSGKGAFMKTEADARQLAERLVSIGQGFGKTTVAWLTRMDEPLGWQVGNWLEIRECIDCLNGADGGDLMELTYLLGGTMLVLGGKAGTQQEGESLCREAIRSGKAMDVLIRVTEAQHGDSSYLKNPAKRGQAPVQVQVTADQEGYITGIDAGEVGMTGIMLKAGRMRKEDPIDPLTGMTLHRKTGESVKKGDALFTIHAASDDGLDSIISRLRNTVSIGHHQPEKRPLVIDRIDSTTLRPS